MNKRVARVIAILLSTCGWVSAIYIGGYWFLVRPVYGLITSFSDGTLTRHILIICIIKIFLSATVAGFFWTGFDLLAGIFRDMVNGREE